jgi:nitroreductase
MEERANAFYDEMRRRRSVRDFSDRPVPQAIIESCLKAAGTAPSGANLQPWHFVVIRDPDTKKRIREAAEEKERAFYMRRAPDAWLEALSPLGTDIEKPFLTKAPYLLAVFGKAYGLDPDGERVAHYYVKESVGLATGILITALHHAGLSTLTYTPSPMGFLNEILERPKNERPYLLLVVGRPADDVTVPASAYEKKPLEDFVTFHNPDDERLSPCGPDPHS